MSGITGIFYRDGRPVERATVLGMAATLAHRGPDGSGIWCAGPAGLGHRMLRTTPESLHEHQPLVDEAAGLVLVADARIDNREELIGPLGLGDREPGAITDSELLLAAYIQWGERCPERLLGDFAFAVWDERERRLFCARDHFGARPFYYWPGDGVFAFASEIKALLCLPGLPRRLNEGRIAEFLAGILDDARGTFYQDVQRLPPGCSITVGQGGERLGSYWSLDPSREIRLACDHEYAEAFREIFTQAVRCRLRGAYPVGVLLSGGLDSSAVTAVARQVLAENGGTGLPVFSAVFDETPQCDERPFIQAVLAQGGLVPHFVNGDRADPLTHLERALWHQDEPFNAPNWAQSWILYEAASGQGIRVLLDGFDGDTAVSYGYGYLKELARAGHWLALAAEMRALGKMDGDGSWQMLWRYYQHYKVDPAIAHYRVLRFSRRCARGLARRLRNGKSEPADRPVGSEIANPDLARRMDLAGRYREWRKNRPETAPDEREWHYRSILQGIHALALEVLDKATMAFSLERAHPFWDKRLVEFCLALPPEQKLRRGWNRYVLRQAMSGVLPPKVQWRSDKTDFMPNFSKGLLARNRAYLDDLLQDFKIVEAYIDVAAVQEAYTQLLAAQAPQAPRQLMAIWRAVSLALWLRSFGGANAVQ